jgi:hypothetical protein
MLLENDLIPLRRLLICRWCFLGLEEISMCFLNLLHLHLELVRATIKSQKRSRQPVDWDLLTLVAIITLAIFRDPY